MLKKTRNKKYTKISFGKCAGCDNCCTKTVVPVTHHDVKRIMDGEGLKADKFIRLYDSTEVDTEHNSDGWFSMDYGKRMMGLKAKENRCMFLSDGGVCTIYKSRPQTCRTFPFSIIYDEDGKLEEAGINDILPCNFQNGVDKPSTKDYRLARQEDHETESYLKKLEKWDLKPRRVGKAKFLAFLGLS
jgi:Fe-S-cluster containining protein